MASNTRRRRRLGQHFLFHDGILRRIVDYASLTSDDVVLEVGAGLGSLTSRLAEKAGRVIAVEKDLRLYRRLRQTFSHINNVEVLCGDVFRIDIPCFNKVVSNLPYSISKRFILWLLKSKFEKGVLLLQKEYADKLTAIPGSKNYSWISMIAQLFAQISLGEVIPASFFKPKPKVDSRIVVLNPRFKGVLHEELKDFSLRLFSYKNKRLVNALKLLHGRSDAEFLRACIGSIKGEGLPLNIRVYQLTPDAMEKVFKTWSHLRQRWRN
ncbi:MAG: 16S rRNA (adenine(1518)-N(6)/adenine(1519)-N(6))-dimethyltransferase RsmA [Candidatus Bathyarchaeia archaeon]